MTTHLIQHDSRSIEVHVDGPPDARRPVVFLHAAPGGAGLDPDPVVTAAHDVRLIGIDRPGYGGSSSFEPGTWPSVATVADDVVAVLDHLGLDAVAVCGWSAGGRVALAAAARHPERFTRVGVLGTPAPNSEVEWTPPDYQRLTEELAARDDPDQARRELTAMMGGAFGEQDGESWLRGITTPADGALLEDRALLRRLADSTGHGMAPGISGMTDDVLAYVGRPWGFAPAQVQAPTLLAYGEGDEVVPPAHGEWYASQVSRSELLPVPDVGHLVLVPAWEAMLEFLLRGGR